jgi:hypothetical protein
MVVVWVIGGALTVNKILLLLHLRLFAIFAFTVFNFYGFHFWTAQYLFLFVVIGRTAQSAHSSFFTVHDFRLDVEGPRLLLHPNLLSTRRCQRRSLRRLMNARSLLNW